MSCAACPSSPWWTGAYPGAHVTGCPELGGRLRGLSEEEHRMLQHVTMWGSDGYGAYIHKLKRGWVRTDAGAPPTVYRRRKEAVEALETFLRVLRDALAGRL